MVFSKSKHLKEKFGKQATFKNRFLRFIYKQPIVAILDFSKQPERYVFSFFFHYSLEI